MRIQYLVYKTGINKKSIKQENLKRMEHPENKLDRRDHICKYCEFKCDSETGLVNHLHRKHEMEPLSELQCWTCGKQLTKEELLTQHFSTVMHPIKCRSLLKEEKSKMPPSKTITDIITEHRNERKQAKWPYRSRLFQRNNMQNLQVKRRREPIPSKYLRTDPALIPLEQTALQAGPRTEPLMTCLDLVQNEHSEDFSKKDMSTSIFPS